MARIALFVLFAFSFILPAAPAFAEDAPQEETAAPAEPAKDEAKKEEPKKEEPKDAAAAEDEIPEVSTEMEAHRKQSEKVFTQIKEIAKDLDPQEKKHFHRIYETHNIVGAVSMVQADVGKTIEGCGQENPDMKETLDKRYKLWSDAIGEVKKESAVNVDNMIAAQDYAKPAAIRKIMKGLDKTRELASKQIEKKHLTTKDACEHLLETMDDTQEKFISLLRATLVSMPPSGSEGMEKKEPKEKIIPSEETPGEKPAEEPAEETPAEDPAEAKQP